MHIGKRGGSKGSGSRQGPDKHSKGQVGASRGAAVRPVLERLEGRRLMSHDDTLATAIDTGLGYGSATFSGEIGDEYGSNDYDLFRVQLNAGDTLQAAVGGVDSKLGTLADSVLVLFNSLGVDLANNDDGGPGRDSLLTYEVSTGGAYYVGVSSYSNFIYNPNSPGSGTGGKFTGTYQLDLSRTGTNAPPTANGDGFSGFEDSQVTGNVLFNDSDPNGNLSGAQLLSDPAHGSLSFDAAGNFTYTPAPDFFGSDGFTYRAYDADGVASDAATVLLGVQPRNDAPAFTRGADETVPEDAGLRSVPGWAQNVRAGPFNERGQAVWFTTDNDNPALFDVAPSISPEGTLSYRAAPDTFGTATVTVQLWDDGGTAGGGQDAGPPQTFAITVSPVNDAPVAAGDSAGTGEDNPVRIAVLANDSAGPANEGDQSLTVVSTGPAGHGTVAVNADGTVTYTPAPNYNGSDSFTYRVRDSLGGFSGDATVSVTINPANDAPTAEITGPAAGSVYAAGTAINLVGAFGDVDADDVHTAVWTLSSVTSGTFTVPGVVSGSGVTGSTSSMPAGVYRVTLAVTDAAGASVTDGTAGEFEATVVVYDPEAGFVTGGGWIDSPAGAYAANPTAVGKAHFGFVSRYRKGAAVPTGQTEFNFKAGNLKFHSSSYDRLVVSGARAQYRGTGTINGSGTYRFALTVVDGQQPGGGGTDKFRIRIWSDAAGLVYDNQMGAGDDD